MSNTITENTAETKYSGPAVNRKTIVYLAAEVATGNLPIQLWSGVIDGAQECDYNLIGIVGGNVMEAQNNIVYDLATPEVCTGIINWTMRKIFTDQELMEIHARYQSLPMVTIGRTVPGCPMISSDDFLGMQEAVVHLIEIHGCRRIAFVRGREDHNPLSTIRFNAYKETLEKYKIPFDPELVTPEMEFAEQSGEQAVALLLDERELHPGQDLDAIVLVSDIMAMTALKALKNRDIQVPDDLALSGFNNSIQVQVSIPSVTSVDSQIREQGQQAVSALKDLLEKASVPDKMLVPTRLVVHQSCGCVDKTVERAAEFIPPAIQNKKTAQNTSFTQKHKDILHEMLQALSVSSESEEAVWAEKLLKAFSANLDAPDSDEFLSVLLQILQSVAAIRRKMLLWQDSLSAIQRHISLCHNPFQAFLLIGQARTLIGQINSQYLAQQEFDTKQHSMQLRILNQKLSTSFDIARLVTVLQEGMPSLGIPACYLALYENPQPYHYLDPVPEWSRLILAYDKDRQFSLEPEGTRFPTHQILPQGMRPENRRYTIILQALYFEESHIGYILFEVGPKEWSTYDILRSQISSSLQGALLFEQAQEHAGQLDTIINETLIITEEMQATISETSKQARSVSDAAQESMDVSETGTFVVENAISGMIAIQHHVEDIARSINKLTENTQKIEEIIVFVETIAEKSKIMALNASIQAARAGEKGRGFAVVANEMQKLAEQSREATTKISKIIVEIQQAANTAVTVSKEGSTGAGKSMELAKHAGDTIHDLTATINEAAQLAAEIAASTQQQSKAMVQLVTSMQSVKEASTQTSTSFNKVGL